jgi:putative ABC transport system permease protein
VSQPWGIRIVRGLSRCLALAYPAQFRRDHAHAFAAVAEDRWRREQRRGAGGTKATLVTIQVLIADTVTGRRAARHATRMSFERSLPMIDRLAGHVRYAVRGLWREPFFLFSAALTLAVGISGLAVTGGLADAILFKPITHVAPDRVFFVTVNDQGRDLFRFSAPEVDSLRRHLDTSALITSVSLQSALVRAGDVTVQTLAEVASSGYFRVLPVQAVVGRLLTEADDRPDAPPVTVVSEPLWQRLYGRAPSAVGASVFLNGASFTIVGVAPAAGAVSFAPASVDLWVPMEHGSPLLNGDFRTDAVRRPFMLVGRLRDQVTRARLSATLTSTTADFTREFAATRRNTRLVATNGQAIVGSQRATAQIVSGLLAALTLLVLVVVGANVGGLFMARATARRRSAAVCLSLGASRASIVWAILTEAGAMGVVAGGCSLAAYAWFRYLLASITVLPTLTLRLDLPFDRPFIMLVMAASVLSGMLLALGPAWSMARIDLIQTLRAGSGPIWGGPRSTRSRRVLVAAQVASSLVLVVLATQFTRGLDTLRSVDLGVDMDHLAIVDLDREPSSPPDRLPVLAEQALDVIRTIPGVAGAVMSTGAPVDPNLAVVQVSSAGQTVSDTTLAQVTPGYFDVVGVHIVVGRGFSVADPTDPAHGVAVVNEVLARRLTPRGSPVGQDIDVEPGGRVRIIGVARNAHYRSVSESPHPHLYVLTVPRFDRSILVRASGDPRPLLPVIQRALDGVGPGVQGFFPRTGRDHLTFDLLPTELASSAARAISFAAIALSTVGLYGLMSWLVELRRPELGVRIALGAKRRDIRHLMLRAGARSAAPGLVVGAVLAVGLARLAGSQVVGVSLLDPTGLVVGAVALAAVVLAASWLPAQRAARIDPIALLRQT